MNDDERPTELNTDEARAGATPNMTRPILAISMVLIIVIFAAIFLWGLR